MKLKLNPSPYTWLNDHENVQIFRLANYSLYDITGTHFISCSYINPKVLTPELFEQTWLSSTVKSNTIILVVEGSRYVQ